MIERVIIAGSGGQGVMLLGKVLAEAAMRQGWQVSWFPAYGPEVRGGTSYCMVVISDRQIGSPYIDNADTVIVLNNPSLEKFKGKVGNKGMLIANSSLAGNFTASGVKLLSFPFTDIAMKIGNIKVTNMVVLGCYLAAKKIVDRGKVLKVFDAMAPSGKKEILAANRMALQEGEKLING
ncbi:MAG: 2-oxoacid:acceptor oxidoreductase family protein [Candidatus Omnitrophota bacterium]